MDISAGSEINISGQNYRVEERLGSGSQGQVFKGRSATGETVALKFVTDSRRRNREADILEGWSSEHVVGLLGRGSYGKGEVLVMDLVDGVTLQQIQELCARLERGLHPALALDLIAHVARGLDEGYKTLRLKVHRDVKPSNIMLGREGRAKILDFGIAYGLDLTVTGTPVATPLYMAPEQMEGARPCESLDHRTDQYSLGLLLAELVLGKPLRPMERDALARWLFVPGAELESATERVGRQAPEVLEPLKRMLAWEPEGRFDDMGQVVEALEAARLEIEAPETVQAFAERLMQVRDQGILLHPDDPALLPLITRIPLPTETILPDITGRALPVMPVKRPGLSPMMERRGPVNLAEPFGPPLRNLEATGAAALRSDTLEPEVTPRVADTLEPILGPQRKGRRFILTLALLLGAVGGGAYYSGAFTEAEEAAPSHIRTERVTLSSAEVAAPSQSEAAQREALMGPTAKAKDPVKAGAKKSTSSAEKTAKHHQNRVKSEKRGAEKASTSDKKVAEKPNWRASAERKRIPLDLSGDVVALPQPVITGARPGAELSDDENGASATDGAPQTASTDAEAVVGVGSSANPAPTEKNSTKKANPEQPEAQSGGVDSSSLGKTAAANANPEQSDSEAADAQMGADEMAGSEKTATEGAPAQKTAADQNGAKASENGGAEVELSNIEPSNVEAGGDGAPVDPAALANAETDPAAKSSEAAEARVADKAAQPEAVAALPVEKAALPDGPPKKPTYLNARQWSRQLVSYGIAARSRGDEALAQRYFEWAQLADPSHGVVEKVASGALNRLPPMEEAGPPAEKNPSEGEMDAGESAQAAGAPSADGVDENLPAEALADGAAKTQDGPSETEVFDAMGSATSDQD